MEGSVLSYVTDHNDAADDEDAHLGDCEASAIRGYPHCGAQSPPRNARLGRLCRVDAQVARPYRFFVGRWQNDRLMPHTLRCWQRVASFLDADWDCSMILGVLR